MQSRIYEELKISCQPVAINSGYVWPKKGLKISNKKITISILKPIKAGLAKEEFIKILENSVYEELNQLNQPFIGITTNILSKSPGSLIRAGEPVSLKNISTLSPSNCEATSIKYLELKLISKS